METTPRESRAPPLWVVWTTDKEEDMRFARSSLANIDILIGQGGTMKRTKRDWISTLRSKRPVGLLAFAVCFLVVVLVGTVAAVFIYTGPTIPPPFAPISSTDSWDINQGIFVTASSGILAGTSGRNMFGDALGGSGEGNVGNVFFQDFRPTGFVHTIDWQTPMPVTIRSFNLSAQHDGFPPRDARARDNSDTTPDACRIDCTLPACGDDIVDPTFGEECEGNIGCVMCLLDDDEDAIPNSDDTCPLDPDNDADEDGDGVCGDVDICLGDDATGHADNDGVCDDIDPCPVDVNELCLFPNQGQCISNRIAQECGGLTGQARAACNHEQQQLCKDVF